MSSVTLDPEVLSSSAVLVLGEFVTRPSDAQNPYARNVKSQLVNFIKYFGCYFPLPLFSRKYSNILVEC